MHRTILTAIALIAGAALIQVASANAKKPIKQVAHPSGGLSRTVGLVSGLQARPLQPALQAQGRNYSSRLYPLGETVDQLAINSYLVTIRLTDSVRLRLYAKTNRRIRLEVLHQVAHEGSTVPRGGHTTEQAETVYDWLHEISVDAARRANEVLSNIRSELMNACEQRSVYQLLSELRRVVDDEPTFDLVLSLLINNSRIVLGDHDTLTPYVNELLRRGVLVRTRRSQRIFSLHSQYRAARDELRGARRQQT
jgi:hypothetical protein